MWGVFQEEMEVEVSKGVLNSAGTQSSSHDCLHDHECVKVGKSWNCAVQYTLREIKRRLNIEFLGLSKLSNLSVRLSSRMPS